MREGSYCVPGLSLLYPSLQCGLDRKNTLQSTRFLNADGHFFMFSFSFIFHFLSFLIFLMFSMFSCVFLFLFLGGLFLFFFLLIVHIL